MRGARATRFEEATESYERVSYLKCDKCGASVATVIRMVMRDGKLQPVRDLALWLRHVGGCLPTMVTCPGCGFVTPEKWLNRHVTVCPEGRAAIKMAREAETNPFPVNMAEVVNTATVEAAAPESDAEIPEAEPPFDPDEVPF